MPQLANKQVALVKLETVAGTYSTPAATDAVLCSGIDITPVDADTVSLDYIRPFFGASPELLATKRTLITLTTYLTGVGVKAGPALGDDPQISALWQACGLRRTSDNSSITFTPTSTFFRGNEGAPNTSASIACYVDGTLHQIRGCRGTFTIDMNSGELPTVTFTMTGHYTDPSAAEAPAVDFSPLTGVLRNKYQSPQIVKTGNTKFIFNTTPLILSADDSCVLAYSMDVGNEVVYRECVGSDLSTGQNVLIVDRDASGSITADSFRPTTAKNPFKDAGTGAGYDISVVHGTERNPAALEDTPGAASGDLIQINAPSVSVDNVAYGEESGIVTLDADLRFNPNTGNDEFAIVYA